MLSRLSALTDRCASGTKLSEPAMRDVSIPYCFICLLHLCNENGLELKQSEGLGDFNIVRS